jgi:hypothetical protein
LRVLWNTDQTVLDDRLGSRNTDGSAVSSRPGTR